MSLLNGGFYSSNYDILPPQNIPLKDKLSKGEDGQKSWAELCMDALETIGKNQYIHNLPLIENYEMVKGRFLFHHYFDTDGYKGMVSQLMAEFELPNYLRHYDIISNVFNTLSGEWQKKPDLFKVRQVGEGAANEYLRVKTELTKKYVFSKIEAEINKKLLEQGIDVNREDFSSEEEAMQFQQQVGELKNQMTPLQIQKFMDTDFLTLAEMWGQSQLEYDKEYFNLPEKEKVEFEDMLVADRCFRHFYVTPTGYEQETWNPVNTFFHKSPEITYIEDGDYVGRIFHLSINTIIDRYGWLMTKEDLNLLSGKDEKDNTKWSDSKYNWVYNEYLVPFKGYPAYDIMKQSWNRYSDGSIPFLDNSFFNTITDETFYTQRDGFYFVTEAYWKTQKTLIKITYIDEDLGDIVERIVDETFIMPKEFVESNRPFDEQQDINTYVKTQVNEVWKGIKINTGVDKKLRKDLYLAIGPNEFQFKGDFNRYGCKLPVCGQVFSVRNSRSMSLVDMMKPYQIGYNVAMNQLYQLAEKEVGMFMVFDVNLFPNSKDWGGEDAWDKWMLVAKNLGMLPADTSPQNIKNSLSATGGFLPKVIDLNLAGQMVSRMNMAKFFEEQALKQVGFNEYRVGAYSSSATATGIQQGAEKSYAQTESLFTNFSNYLRRCYQMGLHIAQYVQSQKEDVTFTFVKSDLSRAFIKVLGTELLLADLNVRVSNSHEHERQLEMIRQFALQNNTSGMSPVDVADVIMMNSPAQIRKQLEVSYNKLMQQQQQSQQLAQQELEQQKELAMMEIQNENNENQLDRENKIDLKKIEAGISIINNEKPEPDNSIESQRIDMQSKSAQDTNTLKSEKLNLDKQKARIDAEYKAKQLALKQAEINANIQIQNKETETAKILKGKDKKK